jgi:tetratricopeptide (TPR) repeat protein
MRDAGVRPRRIYLRFLLAAVFLYGGLWPLMNVAFLAHRFPAPFLAGTAFFRRYSHMVGGPVEYAANLFSQSYSRHWAGVLAFTLVALGAWAVARGILRRFSPGSWNWPAAAFPLIMLVLASRYVAIVYILPMLGGLAAAWLYMALRERPHNRWAHRAVAVLFLIASIPLYYLLASGFLYLCAMCALFELLVRKRPVGCLTWIAFGAAVPYGMSYVYYEPDIAGRYLRWLRIPEFDAITNGLLAAMYLFAPVGAVVVFLFGRLRIGGRFGPRFRLMARAAGFAALVALASRLVVLHFDTSGWIYADYLVDEGRPEEALASLAQTPDDSDPVRFLTFYALARTGRLLWEMFHYPQRASSDALLLRDTVWDTFSTVADWRSDLYLELGRVNESQRWTHEALAVEGETPRVLERMALVYILNGNPDAAKTFVRALEKVPFQAARARRYLAALGRDPGMRDDPLVARIRPLMLTGDYVGEFTTEQILQQCLEANPSNRMAFEYLLAHYLLTFDMEGLARLAPRLKDFYRDLPTHVEEALVGFRNVNGSLPPGVGGSAISRETESRFQNFVYIWTRVQNGPAEDAWKVLAPGFGGTYWFFYIFGRTAAGPPFQARSDAPQETRGAQSRGAQ